MLLNYSETDDDIESQHFDGSNPQRKAVSEESGEQKPKSLCNIIMGNISIICVSLLILTLTFLTYLGLYGELRRLTMPAPTVTVSSEGPAAEMYPDSMGQYNIMGEVYLYDRAVYKHVDREDRFIIFTGISYKLHL